MKKNLSSESFLSCPLPFTDSDTIQLGHGSGGQMMNDLIRELFLKTFNSSYLNELNDQAIVDINGIRLALSTDSFVVDPLFFPGGDIGELAINGTVNDVCMSGARPLFLAVALILEEGFPLQQLQTIVLSMKAAADTAGVVIVTGDTKVVNKGQCDKLYINTTGLGIIEHSFELSASNLQPEDQIILSGSIGDHGIAILSKREGLSFDAPVASDTAALNSLVEEILKAGGADVHSMRDPTRGGLAAIMNEFAASSQVGIRLYEDCMPIKPAVAGACEMLGLDPLYVANEGKLVASVATQSAEKVLQAMRAHPLGQEAAIIGKVVAERPGLVSMQTRIGGWRIVDMPISEPLPRIC